MTIPLQKRLITAEEYHKMATAGILTEKDRVELIRGEIINLSPIGSKHAGKVNRINRILNRLLGDEVIISVQNPINLGKYSEPEPDIAILKPSSHFYEEHHPKPDDVFLLIEVAESSLKKDQDTKLPLYAANQIPEVWIIDVNNQQIGVYREPAGDFYAKQQMVAGGKLEIGALNLEVSVTDMLGI